MTESLTTASLEQVVEFRQRFWGLVPDLPPDVCWDWLGARLPRGYGRINYLGRAQYAHRISHELLVGPIPDGYQVDHLCRNRACVNPFHLEAVTAWTNTMRSESVSAVYARRVTCAAGHPFTVENTAFRRDGSRVCRTCHRANEAKRRAQGKGTAA